MGEDMADRDPTVAAAVAHWSYRFVSNGVPLADFNDVAGAVERWDDWCAAWVARGEVHGGLGRRALEEGRRLSAGEHFTTAAVCCHFGKFLFVHERAEMRAAHERAVSYRNEALALLRPPGERVEIPWDGITLKANLRKPDGARRPPVVVMAMGLDSAKEEMDTNERVFLDRGLATLAFDGPGQGEGEYARPICPEYERPVAAVIDWLEGRGDVDAARLGIWGVSLGGYYAPRAAAFDKRIRACISLTGPFDWEAIFERIPPITRAAFTARSFSKSEAGAREFSKRMTLRDCANNITCPLYIVGGRLDRVVPPEEAEKLARAAAGPVTMNMIEDGTHVANNRIYKYRTQSADWMAAQLGG